MGSTTIRVSTSTRDQLNELCASTGRSADSVVAELVVKEREASLLQAAAAHWHAIASDDQLLALYRSDCAGLEAFDSELPGY